MIRASLTAVFVLGQAVVLVASGIVTLYWSADLMGWLIHMVGEERALGAASVVHLEGGGKLLTKPSAMVRWTLPFWFLGTAQICAAITMVWLWAVRTPNHVPQQTRPAATVSDSIDAQCGDPVR